MRLNVFAKRLFDLSRQERDTMTTKNKPTQTIQLPTNEKAAVYIRQAAVSQTTRNQEKGQMTTQTLVDYAYKLGWTDDKVVLFVDNGIPGNASIEKRQGLQALVTAIQNGSIKSVLVKSEYTLFRNADMVQVNTFIKLCQEHDLIVVTPEVIYDFTSIAQAHLFRFVLESASVAIYARTNKHCFSR